MILLTSSDTVLQQCGLDAYLFLRFLGGASIFFALASVVVCPILLPWNAVLNSEGKRVGLSRLQWAGVGAGPGYRWVNTLVTLFMAAAFCGVVNREMRETIRLRELEQWFPANRNQLLVLLRRETSQTSRRWWDNYDHRKVKPAVLFGEHQKVLSTAINEQTSARDRLEEALTRFISQSISSINKKVDVEEICAKEYISAWLDHSCPRQSSSSASLWGWIRAIFWKLSKGQEIDDAVQKLAQATLKVQQVRESPLESPSASSIALQFPDPLSAALAHQTLDCHDLLSTTTPCVVHRDDVDWRQISVGGVERRVRLWVTRLVLGIAIIGWTVPVALSGSMAQLSALSPYVVTLSWLDQLPSVVISILQGCLPPLATSIVILLFVPLLRFILSQRRCVTQQEIELAAQRYHFAFVFVHLFLTVSVASGLTASLYQIIINPNATLTLLADNLPKASNFFLSDVPLRAFSFAGVTYSQVNTLLLNHFPNPRHTITPRQWYARQHSRDIRQWGTLVSMHTLLADIGKFIPTYKGESFSRHCLISSSVDLRADCPPYSSHRCPSIRVVLAGLSLSLSLCRARRGPLSRANTSSNAVAHVLGFLHAASLYHRLIRTFRFGGSFHVDFGPSRTPCSGPFGDRLVPSPLEGLLLLAIEICDTPTSEYGEHRVTGRKDGGVGQRQPRRIPTR